jgi:CRISPR-associated protein Csd1
MLELLAAYAHDHGLEIEPGFKPKDVRWAIVCDSGGGFLDVLELGDAAQKYNRGQTFSKCPETDRGALQAGGKCHFLVETATVIALYGEDANTEKIHEKHRYFISLLGEAGEVMPELRRLAVMLDDPTALGEIQVRLESQNAKPTDRMTFRVGNSFPVDSSGWHEWWRAFRSTLAPERGATKTAREVSVSKTMRCLVSGELIEPVLTHSKIEGLTSVGGQPSGDALICFDKETFRSYGLEQSANAAMSEEAMSTYRAALNDLIRHHSQTVAGTKVVHWFKSQVPVEDDPLSWLQEGGDEKERNAQHLARRLIESIRTGKRPNLAGNSYYALTLSGAAGRVMVRDFIEGPFEELVANILAWFEDLEIVHRDGGCTAPDPKFMAVLGATVRDLKDIPPPRVAIMWRVAARNQPISADVLAQAVLRTKTDIVMGAVFNHARMGLLKAYHIRKTRRTGGNAMPNELMSYRNEQHPSPAYQCGRLMAVLARLQQAALGDVGAGVVQRYYAAAGTTPALVFGRLTRLSQFHLAKLDAGLAYWYESRIAAIWGRLKDALPAALSLEEQSLFALGYYQELAEMRTKRTKEERDE